VRLWRTADRYDPKRAAKGDVLGGGTPERVRDAKVILWAGHCSVHKLFRPEHCEQIRAQSKDIKILVHPECMREVVQAHRNGILRPHVHKTFAAAQLPEAIRALESGRTMGKVVMKW
jgi:NADPH:quinone reductase-like Zn-dependent oxidoreductase